MYVDFKELKSRVSMWDVLSRYGVELRKVNRNQFRGNCPLPQHRSPEKGSFAVNSEKNVWSCQSNSCSESRNGKKGGNCLDFVAWMERVSVREAAGKMSEWFSVDTSPSQKVPEDQVQKTDSNVPLSFQLKDVQYDAYLKARGFDEEECEYLEVGFFPGKGMMHKRVVFPIHNAKGELVAYAGRSIEDLEPRWLFPKGFLKGHEVYNIHRVEEDWCVLVESFWGSLACVRAGVMNSCALMGSAISEEQAKLLSRFKRVAIMMDGDEAGRKATAQVMNALEKRNIETAVILLPKDVQPDSLSIEALRSELSLVEDWETKVELVEEAS